MLAMLMILGAIGASFALLAYSDYWIDPTAFILISILLQPLWAWRRLEAIVHLVQDKTADLQQFQSIERTRKSVSRSREIVLQQAKLLDLAIDSAKSELDFLAAIIDEMPDVVLIFDTQDQLLLHNQRYKALFEIHPLESLTTLDDFSIHFDLPSLHLIEAETSEKQAHQKQTYLLETTLGNRDFVLRTKKISSPLSGDIRIIILIDISELKQSQTQRDRALQFLSHDMRTPIASILSLTSSTSSTVEVTKKITHHAKALLNMMDDFILTISAEANHYKLQHVSLDNLMNDALEDVFDIAATKDVRLIDQSDSSNIFVNVNTRLMVRVFINLLFNAIKFCPNHSIISVNAVALQNTSNASASAIITISNPVIDQQYAPELTPSMPGFGLGLDFVDNVIDKHHGTIDRQIPANGVATVTITLPCELEF
jgi:signal transduction histidine kinase